MSIRPPFRRCGCGTRFRSWREGSLCGRCSREAGARAKETGVHPITGRPVKPGEIRPDRYEIPY